jgi:hypothetical protein
MLPAFAMLRPIHYASLFLLPNALNAPCSASAWPPVPFRTIAFNNRFSFSRDAFSAASLATCASRSSASVSHMSHLDTQCGESNETYWLAFLQLVPSPSSWLGIGQMLPYCGDVCYWSALDRLVHNTCANNRSTYSSSISTCPAPSDFNFLAPLGLSSSSSPAGVLAPRSIS